MNDYDFLYKFVFEVGDHEDGAIAHEHDYVFQRLLTEDDIEWYWLSIENTIKDFARRIAVEVTDLSAPVIDEF